jgi:NADH:ubiquinone oxidoreductase subunit E
MRTLRVCHGPHCSFRGSPRILEQLKEFFKQREDVTVCAGSCTGFCEQGPNVVENEEIIYHDAKAGTIAERIEKRDGTPLVTVTEESLNLDDGFLPL